MSIKIQEKLIETKKGEVFNLIIKSCENSGWMWTIKSFNNTYIQYIHEDLQQNNQNESAESSIIQTFTFTSLMSGKTSIDLIFEKEGETNQMTDTFNIEIY